MALSVKVNYNTIVYSLDEVAIGREGVEEDFKPLRYVVLYTLPPPSLSLTQFSGSDVALLAGFAIF